MSLAYTKILLIVEREFHQQNHVPTNHARHYLHRKQSTNANNTEGVCPVKKRQRELATVAVELQG
jgi:hypothetical protein